LPADQHNSNHSVSSITAVILDYGDVISQAPDPAAMAAMAAMFGLAEDRFRQLYASLRYRYDRGDISPHQYWTEIAHVAGVHLNASQIEQLRETDLVMWSRLNHSVLHWAGELRATGMKTAVLSNMHDDMVQKIRKDPSWAELFDCLTLSSAIHMAKPDAGIFTHLPGVPEGRSPRGALRGRPRAECAGRPSDRNQRNRGRITRAIAGGAGSHRIYAAAGIGRADVTGCKNRFPVG
jgi:putative hydrolase of the HAD superfamily